jgi:hypothetical protein
MTKEGKKVKFRVEKTELTFLEFKEYPSGDSYVLMLKEILKGTGFHISFHKSGEVHFKVTKPAEVTIKIKLETLELLSKDILKEVLREPTDYFECAVCYPGSIYDLVLLESGNTVDLLEVLRRMRYVKTNSKDLLKTLLNLVNSGKIVKNKDLVTIATDNNELILYKPLDKEKLKRLSDNPLTPDKSELFAKYGGFIATVSTAKENNPLIKIFGRYMPGLEGLFDSIKGLVNTNAEIVEPELENFGEVAIESIDTAKDKPYKFESDKQDGDN